MATVCFIAFVLNILMSITSTITGDWHGFLLHLVCGGLCALGFIEFAKKEN